MNKTEDKLGELRNILYCSHLAMEWIVATATNGNTVLSEMHQFYKLAFDEVQKQEPDLSMIDDYLEQVRLITETL